MGDIIHINNIPLSNFNAEMLWEHTVSGNELDTVSFTGKNRTSPKVISKRLGPKQFIAHIDFLGSREERAKNKSLFDLECMKENVVISIGDGFEYHVNCGSLGDESPSPAFTETQYTFSGFRKKPLIRVASNKFFCTSTFPRTDCILSVTAGKSAARYRLWNAWFLNVSAGDKIVFDGINCRILVNGSPRAAQCEWMDFPYLTPGMNEIECADTVTVEYFPTFM